MSGKAIAISRGVAVIGGTAALMIAATFAAFQTNTVTLSANSLGTTNDVLRIWDGGAYASTAPGFSLGSLVPSVESAQQAFYLQNTSPSNLSITVHSPGTATLTNIASASNVHVTFYDWGGNLNSTTLAVLESLSGYTIGSSLLPGGATGNGGVPGTPGNYTVTFSIDAGAITGTNATVSSFNLDFTGTSVP